MTPEDGPAWVEMQRRREERMRYEVLHMLYRATEGAMDRPFNVVRFTRDLGVWHAELYRVIEWLDRKGFVRYLGAGPMVSLTPRAIAYIEREAGGRKSLRDMPG